MERALDAKEISRILSIREKEVSAHLEHIARSTSAEGNQLKINPCQCLACGYLFKDRQRFSRPGKCPKCRHTRISRATYQIKQRS